jgi:hypothetical protein
MLSMTSLVLVDQKRELDAALTELGIAHEFETYERDYNNRIAERINTSMWPCFSRHLLFD